MHLGGTGIWSGLLRYGDAGQRADAAATLEALGYSALWIPDVGGDDLFPALRILLEATTTIVAATGILNIWMHQPADAGRGLADLDADHPNRTLLGLGVSHAVLIDQAGPGTWAKPLTRMREYLDGLDAVSPTVPKDRRVLAALGPKMLDLARDRAAGAHPYLANPEHTHEARARLGADALLAPEQPVVLETDATRAREIAREHVSGYLNLPNYANNIRRLGYTDDDIANGGNDRVVDGIVAWGDEAAIAARVQAHFDAGADHVCIQVLTGSARPGWPSEEWEAIAPAVRNLRRGGSLES
jgi:probable F420-dependent oxidoreductase